MQIFEYKSHGLYNRRVKEWKKTMNFALCVFFFLLYLCKWRKGRRRRWCCWWKNANWNSMAQMLIHIGSNIYCVAMNGNPSKNDSNNNDTTTKSTSWRTNAVSGIITALVVLARISIIFLRAAFFPFSMWRKFILYCSNFCNVKAHHTDGCVDLLATFEYHENAHVMCLFHQHFEMMSKNSGNKSTFLRSFFDTFHFNEGIPHNFPLHNDYIDFRNVVQIAIQKCIFRHCSDSIPISVRSVCFERTHEHFYCSKKLNLMVCCSSSSNEN